jgi:toxin ParE1/3/4
VSASIHFHRLADRELAGAQHWYARLSQQTAQRFADEVEDAVQRIAAAPLQWPVYQGNDRWVQVHHFPYVLYYRLVGPNDVVIMAVAHTARRPGYWRRRKWP